MEEKVLRYLALHDHFCSCGYNLRGLRATCCPECGRGISIPPDEAEIEARRMQGLVEFLRVHDVYCKHCGYNLHGASTNRCPECGATYMLAGGTISPGGGSRRSASALDRTGSRLVLIGLGGSLVLFASALLTVAGLAPITGRRAFSMGLALMPWAIALAWSLAPQGPGVRGAQQRSLMGAGAVFVAIASVVFAIATLLF